MAGIITNVGEDIKSLQQLRREIENVKKALGSIDINVKIDIRKELEQKLQALTKQYDTLVSKAAEADAKLMESAARIDKAVDTITRAQEKASKANSQQTAATDKGQTAAIEVQAQAYLDLKDEIDGVLGTREQNIRQMLREQNAIRLINAEIAQINKSRQNGGGLSAVQSQRLQQLNDDLLTHKQALAEVRQELANNTKLDLAAVGSMNELSLSLSRMRIAYRALNEDERSSQFGQNLLKSIQEADARIKELDATIGNHQRNVGNYQSFNGLNMSVQQIVRELPSATMGVNMFFMAISNNLPIMADQIKLAKEANRAMKAAGGEPVPVWKQLVSSLFSWQSAMMVGITLLTVYGKDIMNWVSNLFRANDAQEQARKEAEAFAKTMQKSHEEWTNTVAQTAGQQISAYRKMQREWDALGSNLNAKKKYVDANKTAFNQLGFAVNGVSDAERVMVGNTDAVVASIMARAKAAAYYAQMQEATERYIKQTEYNKGTVKGGGYHYVANTGDVLGVMDSKNADKEMAKLGFNKNDYKLEWAGGQSRMVKVIATVTGAARQTRINAQKSAKILAENQKKAKDQLDKQINSLQDGLEAVTEENQKLFKKIGVSEYKDYERVSSAPGKGNATPPKTVDYAKITREQSEAERELAYQVAQSRIDAEEDATKREQMQRALNHKKELDDIEKQKNDLIQKHVANAKEIFEADPKNKNKKFDGTKIMLTAAEQKQYDEIRANTIQKQEREDKEAAAARLQSLYDYLREYGTVQEQMYAIAKEYDDKIAKEHDGNRRKILEAEKRDTLAKADAGGMALNIDWSTAFSGVGNVLKDIAKETLREVEAYMQTAEFKALAPESKKAYAELSDKLRSEGVGGTSPFNFGIWGKISTEVTRYQSAVKTLKEKTSAHSQAVKDLQKAEKELSEATDETAKSIAKSKVEAAKSTAEATGTEQENARADADKARQELTDSTNQAAQGIENFTSYLNEMNNGSLYGFANGMARLVTSLMKGSDGIGKSLSELGGKVGGIIGAILQILDAMGDAPAEFISTLLDKVGNAVQAIVSQLPAIIVDVVKGVVDIIGGIVEGIGSWFGSSNWMTGSNEKEVKETTERLTRANNALQKSIDALKESIDKSSGVKAVKSYEDAYKNQEALIKNQMNILKAQMSYHDKHHSNAYYWNLSNDDYAALNDTLAKYLRDNPTSNTALNSVSSLNDIYQLTPEQMKAIATEQVEIWTKMLDQGKYDKSEYWEQYVDLAGQLEELTAKINENLTQTSFSSLHDDFVSTIMDMDATASDFADNFTEMMAKAWTNAAVGNLMDEELNNFYDKWAARMQNEDGSVADLSQTEIAELRSEYEALTDRAMSIRNMMMEATGYTGTSSQNATANGISNISYDQADNLTGIMTSIQIAGEQRNAKLDTIAGHLSIMNVTTEDIRRLMAEQRALSSINSSATREIINNSYTPQIQVSFPKEELQDINRKVGALAAVVDEMRTHGAERLMEQREISENTGKMVKNGMEIKSYVSDIKKAAQDMAR